MHGDAVQAQEIVLVRVVPAQPAVLLLDRLAAHDLHGLAVGPEIEAGLAAGPDLVLRGPCGDGHVRAAGHRGLVGDLELLGRGPALRRRPRVQGLGAGRSSVSIGCERCWSVSLSSKQQQASRAACFHSDSESYSQANRTSSCILEGAAASLGTAPD